MLFSIYLISSKIDWKEISASLGIYTILCWSSHVPPLLVRQKFKLLASSIVQVSMSSSTRCDAVSVSSQLDTYIAEVQPGDTLSVNAFEFRQAWGHSGLVWLIEDLSVRLHRRTMWNASSRCALSLGAQCIVIGPVCLFVSLCLWDCYHDNSTLRASIFAKLGL